MWKGETGEVSTVGLILIRVCRSAGSDFQILTEIVSNRYDFVLYEMFDLEALNRFECSSDV